jgi:hypothetical protein
MHAMACVRKNKKTEKSTGNKLMNTVYLILYVVVVLVVGLIACDSLRLKRSYGRLCREAENVSGKLVFLISEDFRVKATNYHKITSRADDQPHVLGNVLHCKNGCDAGCCGTGLKCKSCPLRLVITNSFRHQRNVEGMEATMELYDEEYKKEKVDVKVDGELMYAYMRPFMMVSVSLFRKI